MNYNTIIFYDFETGGKRSKKSQPLQLSAMAIDGRRLEFLKEGTFNSYMKPIFDDDKAIEMELEPLQDKALEVNKIKKSDLKDAPSVKIVWKQFCAFVNQFNYKGGNWNAPIKAGYNNTNFDDIIINRLCGGQQQMCNGTIIKEPYKFGPWDKVYQQESLFHPIHSIDLMKEMWMQTENNSEIHSLSMDSMRNWLGMDTDGAHDARVDVNQGAELLIRIMKMHRNYSAKTKFKGSFATRPMKKVVFK